VSLALIAAIGPHAFIVSDGAVTELRPNRAPLRAKSDYPKFAVFHGGIAIAATGDLWIVDQLQSDVAMFLEASPGATLLDVVDYVATALRVLRRQFDVREQRLHSSPCPAASRYTSPAVVGFDAAAGRARIFWFNSQDDSCTPTEHTFVAIGENVADVVPSMLSAGLMGMARARRPGTDSEKESAMAMPGILRGIVGEIARSRATIGGNTYTCEIGPDRGAHGRVPGRVDGDGRPHAVGRTVTTRRQRPAVAIGVRGRGEPTLRERATCAAIVAATDEIAALERIAGELAQLRAIGTTPVARSVRRDVALRRALIGVWGAELGLGLQRLQEIERAARAYVADSPVPAAAGVTLLHPLRRSA
jgi:hypothetical protein